MIRKIGIMQGRLSPPVDGRIQAFPTTTWREEFHAAKDAGLDAIEWIFDLENEKNPLFSAAGRSEMKTLNGLTGVSVESVCADYFMTELLISGPEDTRKQRVATLQALVKNSGELGIRHIVLPFVDQSRLELPRDEPALLALVAGLLPALEEARVELHLEISLAPAAFGALIQKIDSPLVKINYDTGNSASLGYDSEKEFTAYGSRIGSVHLKDRQLHGSTVPLGQGAVDFEKLALGLKRIKYQGGFILQAARGRDGEEITWARQSLAFARDVLSRI